MFILGFNMVFSVSFVTCGKQFAYVDRHVDILTRVQIKRVNDKTDRNGQLMQTVET
jgi:hypothetical protein